MKHKFLLGFGVSAACLMASSVTFAAPAKPNSLQAKYYDFKGLAGGTQCVPKGELKRLVRDYKCHIDLDKCEAPVAIFRGKTSSSFTAMLSDQIQFRPGTGAKSNELEWMGGCPGHGPEWVHLLAIKGLGYAGTKSQVAQLSKMVNPANIGRAGANVRQEVAHALWLIGAKKAAEPALRNIINYEKGGARYKVPALQALGRWKSKVAVPFCKKAIVDRNEAIRLACIAYLGEVREKSAVGPLRRHLEKHPLETLRALGRLGDKSAVSAIRGYLEETKQPYRRMPAIIALMNLGQKGFDKEFALYLKGDKPLTDYEKKSIKRAKERAKKRRKKYKPKKRRLDMKMVQRAALESVLLRKPRRVMRPLHQAAKKRNKKNWQGYIYANLALAQLGDKSVIKTLVSELDSPKARIRKAVLRGIGGRDRSGRLYSEYWGLGVVPNEKLIPAILNYYKNEGRQSDKTEAIHAIASIRAMLKAKKG